MRGFSAIACAALAAAACGACTSISGLSGGAQPADGGSTDAAADAGADGASPGVDAGADGRCPFQFCDPFDVPDDLAPWQLSGQNVGTDSIDTSIVYRGTGSLHMQHPAANGTSSVAEIEHHAVLPPTVFLRFFLRFSWTPDSGEFLVVSDASGKDALHLYVHDSNGPKVFLGVYGDTAAIRGATSDVITNYPPPGNQWICLEAQVDTTSTQQSLRVWADGQLIGTMDIAYNLTMATVKLGLGYDGTQNEPARDVWIDELAYDSQRIGCTR